MVSFTRPQGLQFVSDAPRSAPRYSMPQVASLQTGSPLTINYTYDALRRLKAAGYSDGRNFSYVYDPNGNTLEAVQDTGSGPVTTTYTYDAASQLVTAQADAVAWHYVYDENGSLVEVLPGGNEASGAKRYTYNAAGYLTQVESHDGSGWNVQSEMTYNGLGVRMTSSALGLTTHYTSDRQLPLTISSDESIATVLYGLGPAAEKTDEWNYLLVDGTTTPRQLVDLQGEVTLSTRYDPWGGTLELEGTGNFSFGYLNSLLDLTTGLLYVGNGQYYDPATGRFLTRGVNPNNTNPYVPWNLSPTGAIIGPLALLAMFYRRKKGVRGKADSYILLLCAAFMLLGVGMACRLGGGTPAPAKTPPAPTIPPTQTPTPTIPPATNPGGTSTQVPPSPSPSPTKIDPCADGKCTPTPSPTPDTELFIIMPEEVDRFGGGSNGMKGYLQNEPEALLLARLGMGEGDRGNALDIEYVMWTVKGRSIMGISNDLSGPSSIREEVLNQGNYPAYDYASIGGLINEIKYPTWQSCSNLGRRMGAPCPEDQEEFRQTYIKAQEIVSAAVLPTVVSGYDSFVGKGSPQNAYCSYGHYDPAFYLAPRKLAGASIFYDCWWEDNQKLGNPRPTP